MILDATTLLSDDQAITATARSTNVIDLGAPGTPYGAAAAINQDVGKGTEIPLLVQVTETFATLTSLAITVETSANADLSSSVVLSSTTVAAAALVAGYQLPIRVVPDKVNRRYFGVRYTVAGSDATAGKITAGISMGNQSNVTG